MSVGVASVLVCDEETAYKLTDHPCELFICGGTHTLRVADRRPMEIPLLPHETPELYKDLSEKQNRYPGFESFLACRFAPNHGSLVGSKTCISGRGLSLLYRVDQVRQERRLGGLILPFVDRSMQGLLDAVIRDFVYALVLLLVDPYTDGVSWGFHQP